MSDTVIRVENLGKKYVLGYKQEGYTTLRDTIAKQAKNLLNPFQKSKSQILNSVNEFWALQDVSFDIKQGDRVGIIGRNGAGKSTLLKIISRITEPTKGCINIKGRVASLLEVGTGFHPELTGRENIYLNGAILGMSKAEIQQKFDEIVAFAEVEKFLDTPVKRYSSGMYVRLAFAVAAHLEPEILVVDEVLAVGDAEFQRKCLGKMEDIGKEGRTVFFVSHNMGAVITLCDRALLFKLGQCIGDGEPDKIINQYLTAEKSSSGELIDISEVPTGKKLKIRKLKLSDNSGRTSSEFYLTDQVFIEIHYEIIIPGKGYNLGFQIHNLQYGCIFTSCLIDIDPIAQLNKYFQPGYYIARVKIPTEIMRGGQYWIKAGCTIPNVEILDMFDQEFYFSLLDTSGPDVKSPENRNGCILPILQWDISHK